MIDRLVLGLGITGAAATILILACSGGTGSDHGTDGGADASEDAALGPGPCPDLEFPATCPTPPPSWKNDVQPLVLEYCVPCHGPGGSASGQVTLGSYAQVAANRTRCWVQIEECLMPNVDGSPPPLAYPTPAQRQTMVTWMDICNAPDN